MNAIERRDLEIDKYRTPDRFGRRLWPYVPGIKEVHLPDGTSFKLEAWLHYPSFEAAPETAPAETKEAFGETKVAASETNTPSGETLDDSV